MRNSLIINEKTLGFEILRQEEEEEEEGNGGLKLRIMQ